MPRLTLALVLVLLATSSGITYSQTYLFNDAKLVDRVTRQSITLSQPSQQTTQLNLIFPKSAGAANQALFVSDVSGNDVTLNWANTSSASSTSNSTRVATAQSAQAPAGLTLTGLGAGRAYRYIGTYGVNRAANADQFRFSVTAPTGTTFLSMSVRVLTAAGTTAATATGGLPTYLSTTSATTLTTGDINPAGATVDNTTYWYQIEGLVVTGSSTGDLTLTAVRQVTPTADNVNIALQSNMIVSEIQ